MYHYKSEGGLSKGMWQIAAATVANHKVSFLNVIAGTDFAYEAPFLVIGKSSHSNFMLCTGTARCSHKLYSTSFL